MGQRDINDVHALEGLDAVRDMLDGAKPFNREGNGAGNVDFNEEAIPADILRVIREGVPYDQRIDPLWPCVVALHHMGYTVDGAVLLFEKYPQGLARHYGAQLRDQVKRSFAKLNDEPSPGDGPDGNPPPDKEPGGNSPPGSAAAPTLFDPWETYIVPKFPFFIFPNWLQDFVSWQSLRIGCDPSAFAMETLTGISGALDHRFAVKMMRHGAWWEHPRLWTLLIGDPSTKKSPSINAVTDPLERYEADLYRDYAAKLRDYEAAKNAKDNTVPEPDPPERYLICDATTEKLGEILAENRHEGILVKRDEFAGWIGSMDRYGGRSLGGASTDRAFWLKAYDGGYYVYDRISRGTIRIRNLSVSLLGGIQPDRLIDLRGLTSDGLLQRFLPVMVRASTLPHDRDIEDEENKYPALLLKLAKAEPRWLFFSDEALAVMSDLRAHLFELEQASGGLAKGFQAFVGKLPGVAGRLALILQLATYPHDVSKTIHVPIALHIRTLVIDFILPHALEFYRLAEEKTDGERTRSIASWILTSKMKVVTSRDLSRNVPCLRGVSLLDLQKLLSPLVASGWLEPESPYPSNRKWTVTPLVASQFERRRQSEEQRKAIVSRLMGSPRKAQA
jgi:hypothetical protein